MFPHTYSLEALNATLNVKNDLEDVTKGLELGEILLNQCKHMSSSKQKMFPAASERDVKTGAWSEMPQKKASAHPPLLVLKMGRWGLGT